MANPIMTGIDRPIAAIDARQRDLQLRRRIEGGGQRTSGHERDDDHHQQPDDEQAAPRAANDVALRDVGEDPRERDVQRAVELS